MEVCPATAEVWADRLIERFGSLAAAFSADEFTQLQSTGDVRPVRVMRAARSAMLHILRHDMASRPLLGSHQATLDYLRLDMAHAPVEQLRVLYLNAANLLIHDEVVTRGTIDQAPLYAREIMRRAIGCGATAVILVHNHPSGDPKPSKGDLLATAKVVEAGRSLDVTVHDHFIVAERGTTSLRELGYL